MTTITAHQALAMPDADQQRLTSWVVDHGLDPNQVQKITVRGRAITAHLYQLDTHGQKYIDTTTGQPAMRTQRIRMRRALPKLTVGTP